MFPSTQRVVCCYDYLILTVGHWLLVLVEKIVINGGELCSFTTKMVFILMEQYRLRWVKVFQGVEVL